MRRAVLAVTGRDPLLSAAQRQEFGDDEEDETVADQKAFCAAWADAFGDKVASMGDFHKHLAATEKSTDSGLRERTQAAVAATCRLLGKDEHDRLPAQTAMGHAGNAMRDAPVAFGPITVRLQLRHEADKNKHGGKRYRLDQGSALRKELDLGF